MTHPTDIGLALNWPTDAQVLAFAQTVAQSTQPTESQVSAGGSPWLIVPIVVIAVAVGLWFALRPPRDRRRRPPS